jgi:tRNA threonylcarbamoyladenosine biosynthesis protein TsaB
MTQGPDLRPEPGREWLLALDTATTTVVVAAGTSDGALVDALAFEAGYHHSQELLPAIARLMDRSVLRLADLGGIVVGTGPGAFTGLRVGLATAKTLAHELHRPVVGVSTAEALLQAAGAGEGAVVWLPSGPRDLVAVAAGREPAIVRAGEAPPAGIERLDEDRASTVEAVAVDLAGRAPRAALERGEEALARLPAALLELGSGRLARGERDDPELLLPRYASAPRGAPALEPEGGVAWSRDPR